MVMKKNISLFAPVIDEEAKRSLNEVINTSWFGQGPLIDQFEDQLVSNFKLPNLTYVNTNSSAIRMALQIIGVRPGDEIITSPMACTATNLPILEQFALPVFTDIQYNTGNMDPGSIEDKITNKTKAILCYHWGGYPCDMAEIQEIAKRYDLPIIEDATDALGAKYHKKMIGTLSDFTVFSFQVTQKMNSIEGGGLVCLDPEHERQAKLMRWYGIDRKNRKPNTKGYYDFDIDMVGYGYHSTNVNAAVGISHLKNFKNTLAKHKKIAKTYRQSLAKVSGLQLFSQKSDRFSSHHLYTIHVQNRKDFFKAMKDAGIATSIVHERNDVYSIFSQKLLDFPGLNDFDQTYIAIPIHAQMTESDVNYVVKTIKKGW